MPWQVITAVSSEAWAKLRDWASVAGRGRMLLSGSVAHVSLKTTVLCRMREGLREGEGKGIRVRHQYLSGYK